MTTLTALIITSAITIRLLIGQWNYSGCNHAPMFGDFEAQRHWMEITVSLPIGDWYRNTTNNDLLYWGLDYPPVTAYFSLFFGAVANTLYPELVTLHSSRGIETTIGKIFMRCTVIICDLMVFIPTTCLICEKYYQYYNVKSQSLKVANLLSVLFLFFLEFFHYHHYH
jgi:alpha-1,3-glucosyltransferase